MKKKFNWLGFIALIIWDIGFIYYFAFVVGLWNFWAISLGADKTFVGIFNIYYIILFILLILIDLAICRDNKWMITIGVANLIYYAVVYHFDVAPISIIGCILVLVAGIYGLIKENKTKSSSN